MQHANTKILAIDPGTRLMGIAFFDDGKPLYHEVKQIKKGRSSDETLKTARGIVLRLINDFKPNILVVEKNYFAKNKNVSLLNVLVDEIRTIARRKGLKVFAFAPNTVKKFVCGNGHASKKEVSQVVVAKYPELKVYLTQNRAWKERFHQNMFDAVALGMMVTVKA